MSSAILDFSPRTWLALGGTAVALLSGAVFFFRNRSTKLLPGKAPTPAVGFPLGIFNAIHSILKGLGLPSPFKIPKQKYINEAKRLAAIKGAEEFFGNQDEFVEAVSVFLNSVKEETMSASGVLLLNGMLNRFFEMRANLIDYALKHPEIQNYPLIKPIIITGLPRTGSTMLYNLMACDERARAPRFFEISHMAFIAPPNHSKEERENDVRIQECIERFNRVERSYPNLFTEAGKSHRSHPAELEEEVLIMFQAFIMQLWVPLTKKPYHDFYNSPEKKDAAYAFLKTALQVVNSGWQPESHWVLKAPVHSHYLETLVKFFPDARVVFTHRDPTNVVPSWARLLETFLSWYYKENTLDRHELGDYVMESLLSCGENVKEFRQKHDPSTYIDIDYADLFKQPVETVERIYHHFGLEVTEDFREKMRQWMRENRQGKYGRAYYTLEDYGQTDDGVINRFAWYIKDFLPSMHGKLAELEQKQKK